MGPRNKSRLLRLLDKLFKGSITRKEIESLLWFFVMNQKIPSWPEHLESRDIVKEKIFTKVRSQLGFGSPNASNGIVPLYRRNYFRYAVAASIVLLFGLVALFTQLKGDVEGNPKTEIVISNNQIHVGTDRAVLTLADGTEVFLGNGTDYVSDAVNSDGEELVYDNTISTESPEYNYLTVPRGGKFVIRLSDNTQVWLNSDSQIKYPVSFVPGRSRQVELVYGEAYFDVTSSKDFGGSDFQVKHRSQNVSVLGTEFNVKAYWGENNVYTTLVEGKVSVGNGFHRKTLNPSQQSLVNDFTENIEVYPVNVYNEISWKHGVFAFEDKPLLEIMKTLSRWYDMKVIFEEKGLEKIKFNGVLGKEQEIQDILSIIKETGYIESYEIHNKTILLK